ncbi:DoxX family protein [Sedimenticola sp.]|uniref:DoxX family protein n=1 Tax=Sedimenticola sp. TaxID=1940285 RepID=UPI003D1256AF
MKALLARIESLFQFIGGLLPESLLMLFARLAIAYTFFSSGRTKVTGLLDVTDTTLYLFQEEYSVPLIPPDIAAYMAAYAEHFFPILLVLGLFTRFAALSLLIMTLVIQLFVYPDAWNVHMWWGIAMLYLLKHGGGDWALDRLFSRRSRHEPAMG